MNARQAEVLADGAARRHRPRTRKKPTFLVTVCGNNQSANYGARTGAIGCCSCGRWARMYPDSSGEITETVVDAHRDSHLCGPAPGPWDSQPWPDVEKAAVS